MKSFPEYLADSSRLAGEDEPQKALKAALDAVFAYEPELDGERGYDFYLMLGDRYTAAGYFEKVDRCYEKALKLASENPMARAEVLIAMAGSSLILERRLTEVDTQLITAEALIGTIDDTPTDELQEKIVQLHQAKNEILQSSTGLWPQVA